MQKYDKKHATTHTHVFTFTLHRFVCVCGCTCGTTTITIWQTCVLTHQSIHKPNINITFIYMWYIYSYTKYIYIEHTQTCLYLIRISQTIVKHTFNIWTTTTKKKIPWGLKKICWGLINITVPRVSYKPHSISISIFSFNFPVNFCISTLP